MAKTAPPPRRASALAAPVDVEPPVPLWMAAAAFFILSLLYFFPAFLPGRQVYGTDYLAGGYFFYDFFADRFGSGALLKWVPYVYGGMPVYANPGSAYHPVHLLAETLLPTGKVLAAIFVVQFWLAGLGMYLLARELRCRPWVAFVAGAAFQFTGVTMSWVYAGHDGRIMVATMAPLFFYFLHRGIRTGSLAPFAGAAGTLAFALLSFQIQNAYYLILAGFIWSVYLLFHFGLHRRPGALAKTVLLGFGSIAFAFMIAGVNFLPFRDYVGESPRGMQGGRGYEYSTSYSMPFAGLVSMAVPEQQGASIADPDTGRPLFPAIEGFKLHTEYVGAFVLVLLFVGVVYGRSRYWWFFAGLTLFALSMALGGHTPLYRLYYAALPGLNRFRAPDLTFYVAAFSMVVMAALTLEALAERRATAATRRVGARDESGLGNVLWIGVGVVALAVLGAMMAGSPANPGEPSRAAGWMRFALFAGGITAVLWAWTTQRMGSRGTALLLMLLTVLDLMVIDRRFFHTTDGPETAFAADDVVSFLQSQPGPNRVWAFSVPGAGVPTWGRGGSKGGDYPMLFGIEQVAGEHPNPLQRWVEYVGAGEQEITDFHNLLGPRDSLGVVQSPAGEQAIVFNPRPGLLEAANVRYVVSMAPLAHPGLREVFRGSALVYQVANAMDRAYLVPNVQKLPADRILPTMIAGGWNPAQTAFVPADAPVNVPAGPLTGGARVTAHAEDRVTVQTTASRPALMVLADNEYAGWKATVDGRETPIIRTNHTLRGVVVPAGTHNVEFTFHPGDLYTGFYLYLAGFGLLAAYAVFLLVRNRRRGATADGEPQPVAA
ncbi:YfhO family protein [Longimicrobium sp.]|uniref:YfhO family protein n=1 Tax=Longimicrobium sp. TaxID=2029185 RepID=UPI002E377585|nr:YfhO family protein [Longimicrobium sp.]HEX6036475.1 YfhO family protein [Longimicrobium sp.]